MAEKEQVDIHRNAKDLINQISVILRTSQIHDADNVALVQAISRLLSLLNNLLDEESVIIVELRGDFFYINDYRIRYPLEYLLNYDFLVREFRHRELGSLTFSPIVRMDDIKTFIRGFAAASHSREPFGLIEEKMAGVRSIAVGRLKRIVEEESLDIRKMVKTTYFNAVSYTRGVINKIKSGEKVSVKKAKRVVESMVDHILEQEQLLLGMTAIKDYDEYTYHHSVNVSVLSIALGQRIGLSRKMLTELGLVALFHDIGKMEIPFEVLNKPARFTDEEWKLIRKHPLWGAKAILKLKRLDELTIKSAIVAFEHHMHLDHSGYPRVRKNDELDLFSRIVSLADQYDAMTSARVYSRTPMAPDKALSIMMERGGTQLDPLLFKFFTNMVGVYPIGTLVLLDTNELGLVCESNQLLPSRPRVLIIMDRRGSRAKGDVADLAEKDEEGRFLRTIRKTMDPNKYRINLAEYLL